MIHVSDDPASACAAWIAARLSEAVASKGLATLAVSGGSTPKRMFGALAPMALDWTRIHLYFVDERCVPPDDEQSNYRLALENLVEPARIPAENVHRMRGEADPALASLEYAQALPPLDVVQCGIGDDAHTASLFPGEPLVMDRRGIAAALWAESKQQWRITLLPKSILGASHLCVLAAGASKAEAVWKSLRAPEDAIQAPAQILRGAEWFLDPPAASRL